MKEIYKTGSGAIRLRATWEEGPVTRAGKTIYITSVPYTVNKATLVGLGLFGLAVTLLTERLSPQDEAAIGEQLLEGVKID